MKKGSIFLMVVFCFLLPFAQATFGAEESSHTRRVDPRDGTRRDSLLWQRMETNFSFLPQGETEGSYKSMLDTRCNDDGFRSQDWPAITIAGESTLVGAWIDTRHGFETIYAQRFDMNCNPLGSDFKVTDYWTHRWALCPDAAADASGNFVIVWDDVRNANQKTDIYAQRFNAMGEPMGGNFKVNYNVDDTWQYSAKISMDAQGNFVIVWDDWQYHGPYYYPYVYGQRYNSSGVPQGSNFKVNDLDLTAISPDVGMDSVGNFMVVWDEAPENSLYSSDIYGQVYNSSGQRVGNNFRINSDSLYLVQAVPAVSSNNRSEFIVVWCEGDPWAAEQWWRLGARRYSSPGVPQGGSFLISLEDTTTYKFNPHIVMNRSGDFVVAWVSSPEGSGYNVYAQRYNHLNEPQGSNFKVNDDQPFRWQGLSMTMNAASEFFLAWPDDRLDNEFEQFFDADIYCQRYNASGEPQGGNIKLNSENADNSQDQLSISVDNTGSFVLAWTDWRNENWNLNHYSDIFALIYKRPYCLSELGNCRVNTDEIANGHTQNSPSVAGYGSKQILTVWADLREGDWDIYAVRGFYGGEYKVNEDVSPGNWDPSIAADSLGNFVVVWTDARNGYPKFDIYAQRYNSLDEPQGGNFRVNEEPLWVHQEKASVDMNAGGDFVVVWEDFRESGGTSRYIYGQRFNHLGEPQGSNFKVNDQGLSSSEDHYYPDVAIDRAGNFVVAWQRYSDIYAQRYNSSGQQIGGNFIVNDESTLKGRPLSWDRSQTPSEIGSEEYFYTSPRLGVNMDRDGNFVIVWSDYRNGNWDIYAQRYHFTGTAWGRNYRVNSDLGSAPQGYPDIAIDDTCIYYAWLDTRVPEYDCDVYAKIESWSPRYLPGDANGDDAVNSADVTYLVNYLYYGGPPPDPLNAGDPNADCSINTADLIYLVNYLYIGGPAPKLGCVE